ncbi:TIGR02757 family protein [Paludibacter sp. 221]|uniref:TIGR02757 family protein n=1 Tax=Paludibacter sp. 221 TaxID=2302939 RepID=UPI0013D8CC37|nr:TIGR02757 family protein [Paludibacter sp. 221]NDV45854.1 TIGR02757 family protein [Paludibacter sp. 221]
MNVKVSDEIKELLDTMATRFNVPAFIESDPVQFPRRYEHMQDIEVSAFLTATITWGKRSLILKSAAKMHTIMGASPYDYVMGKGYESLEKTNVHRTFFEDDMAYICRGLNTIYNKYDSIETLFSSNPDKEKRIWEGIRLFREHIQHANSDVSDKSLKHVSNPDNSACKRLHLALRWLVRNDGIVDIGAWKNISPSELQIPLDVHVANISRKLGLLQRKQNDRKAVEELTAVLNGINPSDPILYDFALFGIGESKILEK